MTRPLGVEAHKAVARELGVRRYEDLIVQSVMNDPFVPDLPFKVRLGEWFAERWHEHASVGFHLRRLHYRLVSGEQVVWLPPDRDHPGGVRYGNTQPHWKKLVVASAYARHQGLVDASAFVDRRNPDAIVNVHGRYEEAVPRVYRGGDGDSIYSIEPRPDPPSPDWRYALPGVVPYLGVGRFEIPGFDVAGYDYQPVDQPVLVEVWIEKSTMDDVLVPLCSDLHVNLVGAVGTQSISSAVRLLERLREYGKPGHVIYISDHDKPGSTMARSVARTLEYYQQRDFPDVAVTVSRAALTPAQVRDLGLPTAPGTNATELDALEAVRPGELARIVRAAVAPYRDSGLRYRLDEAGLLARQDAGDEWAETTRELRQNLADLAGRAREAARPFQDRLEALSRELDAAMKPHHDDLAKLRAELEGLLDGFNPDLPARPEAIDPPGDQDVLFDSRRDWRVQLDRYKLNGGVS